MKEIKSDKVFEKKIRVYDIRFMEELNEFYQKHKKEYPNVNGFLTSLIRTGLDVAKIADKNRLDYAGKFASISDKLTDIQKSVDDSNRGFLYNLKDLICTVLMSQKVLMRIYNMALANNEGLPLNNELVKATFYDDLPAELQEMEKDIKDFYANSYFKDVDDKKQENEVKE